MSAKPLYLFLVAGEASGDLHASNLIRALQARAPGIRIRGMAGERCAALGMERVRGIEGLSFMGYWEVLKNLRFILGVLRLLKQAIADQRPDALVLVDYPGFNLRLARYARTLGIPVLYYISPQFWAWRKGRIRKIRRYVDRLYVILPFEQAFYAEHGIEVDYVGHPLLDALLQDPDRSAELRAELGLDSRPVVALLPGSRRSEVERLLPIMLQVVPRFPGVQFVVAGAPGRSRASYAEVIGQLPVALAEARTYDLLRLARAAIVCSGTATLETGLFRVPQVIGYAGNWISYRVAMWVIRVPYISLVNLILNRKCVEELLQYDFEPQRLAQELERLLHDEALRARMAADYAELWHTLGDAGASARTAEAMLERLGQPARQSA